MKVFGFLEALDGFWASIFRRVTKAWCWLTGKSNFTLARIALVCGIGAMVVGFAIRAVQQQGAYDYITLGLFSPIWILLGALRWREFDEIERAVEDESDVLNISPATIMALAFSRCFFGVLVFLILLPPYTLPSVGLFLYFASLHFVTHVNKGGKSVVKRAVGLVKKGVEKLKDLVPEPTPVPVPALVGA